MGGSEAKPGAGSRSKERLGGKREAAGARHGWLTPGATLLHASGNGVSQVWGKRPPRGSQSPGGAVRDEGLSRPRRRVAGRGGEEARPPQLLRSWGSLPETPPPPAPDVATATAARQSHPPGSVAGPDLPPQVGAVDNGRAPQPQDPGTGSGSSAVQGRSPTPAAAMMDYEPLTTRPGPASGPAPGDVRCAPRGDRDPPGAAFWDAAAPFGSSLPARRSPAPHDLLNVVFPSAR